MKIKQTFAILFTLSMAFFTSTGRADDITAIGSGSWGDTNIWSSGTVPGTNDDADIPSGFVVTVDTNATVQYIYDAGTVAMTPNSTLTLLFDQAIDPATTLLSTAPGNTVVYSANAYDVKPQGYYNLVLNGLGTFYNGVTPSYPATAMTIAGDMTISGTASVQAGADITIGGNLVIGTTNSGAYLDCSVSRVIVQSNTIVNGFLLDGDGSLTNPAGEIETNEFLGNVTVNPGGTWNISDVTTWSVGGNFTNLGTMKSKKFGSISFNGTGDIAGNAFQIPTMTVNGTYAIGTTITLATNTPTLNGTLVFDIANTNKLILNSGTNRLYYSGALHVLDSGAQPASGQSYKLFNCPAGYGGSFSATNFPSLSAGLSWVDNTLTSGSISVAGTILGSPNLTLSKSGGVLTLSWDSTTFPGYSVQSQTNSAGIHSNWEPTGSGTVSPFMITINPANPPVFFRLSNP